jgi:hypothetical protein
MYIRMIGGGIVGIVKHGCWKAREKPPGIQGLRAPGAKSKRQCLWRCGASALLREASAHSETQYFSLEILYLRGKSSLRSQSSSSSDNSKEVWTLSIVHITTPHMYFVAGIINVSFGAGKIFTLVRSTNQGIFQIRRTNVCRRPSTSAFVPLTIPKPP